MLLSLKNVSKFYYSKGVVTSGFSKVSLQLDRGEFVAITGESGSGKSTLLNVISGLDTYEEGEMSINGTLTSAYTEKEFEQYRKQYIANVFQSFNLVSSYNVYQNVALILMINGEKNKEIKKKVLTALKQVGLYEYRHTKASKLSGGQKQRVAIARALVKDTPIIVADEPTGNLDVKAAEETMKLFSDIAKDKLVIIVTHNYEQVEPYVTRKIRMSDGRIVENEVLKPTEKITAPEQNKDHKSLSIFNQIRLGLRNTFNLIPKFILLMIVFLFMTVSSLGMYSSFRKQQYDSQNSGYNWLFRDSSDARLIIKKQDNSAITDEDLNAIKALGNIDYIVNNDVLIDTDFYLSDNQTTSFDGTCHSLDLLDANIIIGSKPVNDNEILINCAKDDYLYKHPETALGKELKLNSNSGTFQDNTSYKIVGIANTYQRTGNQPSYEIYVTPAVLSSLQKYVCVSTSKVETYFQSTYFSSNPYNAMYVATNANVPVGQAFLSEAYSYLCKDGKCGGIGLNISSTSQYYTTNISLTVGKTYNEKNITSLLGLTKEDSSQNYLYINPADYNALFTDATYQASVYVKDVKTYKDTMSQLTDLGYKVLHVKDTLVKYNDFTIFGTMFTTTLVFLVIAALFFISYFIIRLIFRSRNVYFATIRMLGATKNNAKSLLYLELFTDLNISYLLTLVLVYLIKNDYVLAGWKANIGYLQGTDYLILYLLLAVMCLMIGKRYSRQLFKASAISVYKERD